MTPFMKDLVIRRIGAWKFKWKKPSIIPFNGILLGTGIRGRYGD